MADCAQPLNSAENADFDRPVRLSAADSGKQSMDNLRGEMARLKERQVAGLKADAIRSDRTTRTRTLVFLLSGILKSEFPWWGYRRIAEAIKQRDKAFANPACGVSKLEQQKICLASRSQYRRLRHGDRQSRSHYFHEPDRGRITGWNLNEAMCRPSFRRISNHE